VLSSPRQQSFVPDGGPAKLIFGLSAPQNVTASFRTAAWILYSNRAPIFIALCDRQVMKNYLALTLRIFYKSVSYKVEARGGTRMTTGSC
jgi:hypothetical protein